MKPRDYQQNCIDATWEVITSSWTDERPTALAVLPTGAGKTICFAHLSDRWIKSGRGRVLILAHRRELIDQAAAKFERVAGYPPQIEMADLYAARDAFSWDRGRVVVGSVATMRGNRLLRWGNDAFSLIITDEAHHATAPGYKAIYSHFHQAALVGVTATPDRTDKSPLGKIFKTVSYSMQILDSIQKGWLVPIRQKFVHVESIDLSGVENNWKGDDFDETKLDQVMRQEENVHKIAKPTFDTAHNRPTLVFCTGVSHAKQVSDVLNSYRPACSEYVASYILNDDGTQSAYPEEKRASHIKDFQEGKLQFLCSCGVFLEGFDAPPTAMISMARPTKSRSLYAQALGRGTRPLDGVVDPHETAEARIAAIAASAKPDCLILDFVGNSGKHKLVYADDILFPEGEAEVRERARHKANNSQEPADVREVMEQAEQEIKQERIVEIDRVRRTIARRLNAEFHMQDVNPFGHGESVPQVYAEPNYKKASDKQKRFVHVLARKLGKKFDQRTLDRMPMYQVQGIIGNLQKQLAKRHEVMA